MSSSSDITEVEFSKDAIMKKFARLTDSQQAIEFLTKWIIWNNNAKVTATAWEESFNKTTVPQKQLVLIYLLNDLVQHSNKAGATQFQAEFSSTLSNTIVPLYTTGTEKIRKSVGRIVDIWSNRKTFDDAVLGPMRSEMGMSMSSHSNSNTSHNEKKSLKRLRTSIESSSTNHHINMQSSIASTMSSHAELKGNEKRLERLFKGIQATKQQSIERALLLSHIESGTDEGKKRDIRNQHVAQLRLQLMKRKQIIDCLEKVKTEQLLAIEIDKNELDRVTKSLIQ